MTWMGLVAPIWCRFTRLAPTQNQEAVNTMQLVRKINVVFTL